MTKEAHLPDTAAAEDNKSDSGVSQSEQEDKLEHSSEMCLNGLLWSLLATPAELPITYLST